MCQIPRHIVAAGLLVRAEQNADAAGGDEARVLERCQCVQRGHGRPLVVHRAAAVDAPVFDLAGERRGGVPSVAGRHNVQMAEHGDHFLALAVFAPADAVVHIHGGEAQALAQRERFVQAARDLSAVGCARLGRSLDAGDADEGGQALQQLVRMRADIGLKVHIYIPPLVINGLLTVLYHIVQDKTGICKPICAVCL